METYAHCLLGEPTAVTEESHKQACWDELADMLEGCGREGCSHGISIPGSANIDERRARARETTSWPLWLSGSTCMTTIHLLPWALPAKPSLVPLWTTSIQNKNAAHATSSTRASASNQAMKRSTKTLVGGNSIESGSHATATT